MNSCDLKLRIIALQVKKKEGYIRMSSEDYSVTDQNQFIHLTNNAIQKFSKKYGQYEKGNQLSFAEFEKSIKSKRPNFDFEAIKLRMKQLIILTYLSIQEKLNYNQRKYCFEIFGFDFLIDDNFQVWLIEVNTNPCLETSSPLLSKLIPRMIHDAFQLTVDKIFPPKGVQKDFLKTYPIDGFNDEENLWEPLEKSWAVLNLFK